MARKDRNLASFADVAEDITTENNENSIIDNNNNVVKNNNDNKKDLLDDLLGGKKKPVKNVWTGVYLKPEIAAVLDKVSKKGGKGAKSDIVNESLRQLFVAKGLLKEGNESKQH